MAIDMRSWIPERQAKIVACIIIAALTFSVFSPTLKNDFIGWDDDQYILESPYSGPFTPALVGDMFATFYFQSYTPLTLLAHAANVQLWGLDPRGHHLVNVLLHSMNAVLVFFIATWLLRLRGRSRHPAGHNESLTGDEADHRDSDIVLGAAAAAFFFAFSPLRVESVACASSLKDLLSTFFALGSVGSFLKYGGREDAGGVFQWYLTSLILFACALLAKGAVLTLPLIFVILYLFVHGTGVGWRRAGRLCFRMIPFFLISAVAGYAGYEAASSDVEGQAALAGMDVRRATVGLYNIAFYAVKTIWPFNITLLYDYPEGWPFILTWLLTPAVSLICLFLWFRGSRAWLFAWGIYLVAVSPLSAFFPLAVQPTSNRYAYFAMIPVAVLFGGGFLAVLRSSAAPLRRWTMGIAMAVVVAGLALVSIAQMGTWRDAESVWRRSIELSPRHPLGYAQMGHTLFARGDAAGALQFYDRALLLDPGSAENACNMGAAHLALLDTVRAVAAFNMARKISPTASAPYNNLGNVRMLQGRYEEALAFYRTAAEVEPRSATAAYNLACVLVQLERYAEAVVSAEKALTSNPHFSDALYLRGMVLTERMNDPSRGVEALRNAARLGHMESQRVLTARGESW